MSSSPAAGRQGSTDTILGWIMAIAFAVLLYNIISLPRTALDQREGLRVFHDSLGLLVSLFAAWCLIRKARGPALLPPPGLPAGSFGFNRALLAALYVTFAVSGVVGLIYGFGEFHREVNFFGWQVPALIPDSDAVRKAFGYLHSSLGFYYLFLIGIWLVFGIYQHLRYRVGLLRLLPGSRV